MFRQIFLRIADGFNWLERASRYLGSRKPNSVEPYILRQPTAAKPKATVVHVNGNFIIGGNTQLIVDLIERTSDQYSHEVVVPSYPRPLPYQPVNIHEYSILQMPKLFEYLESKRPDFIHMNYWVKHARRYGQRAVWFQSVFKICEELNIPVLQNITVPAQPFISPVVRHNVFVSRFVAENFNVDPDTPWSVIHPGSDFSHFRNDDIGSLPANSIGMVYRLDRDKLNGEAIGVFITAVKKKPALTCHIVGDGPLFDLYRSRVKEEGLGRNFVFHGQVSYRQLPKLYKSFSVFAAPVHDESFGQVTPFAMSMGQAVAGYDVGALSEILGSNETLVESGNVDKLSDLLVALTDDREKRVRLGEANQKRAVKNFSVEMMIEKYSDLYARMLRNDG
ncbi:MAG TPA: glycosyltransferase family 4 protein [Pyrinomonadaceae bacterium]|nr:glycosyltransferase family 4 protein [Pyrinomonadaceae bacterium]